MKLKEEAVFISITILAVLALLIIGKFFIWDEYIKPKEKEEIPQPEIIPRNVVFYNSSDYISEYIWEKVSERKWKKIL